MRKSYSCEKLEKTLHFLPDGVKFCCSCAEGAGLKILDFSKFNNDLVIKSRKEFVFCLKSGIIPNQCLGCVEYKEITLSEKLKSLFNSNKKELVSHIIIDHYKQCDCNCVYCSQKKLFPDTVQKYQILPIIKQLYELNMIDKENLKVEFQGGNVSVLNEFDDLMNIFKSQNCNNFIILSNFIKYIPQIEDLDWRSILCVSLDSGCKETFQKIKNVDAFNDVVENLKKLRSKSQIIYHLKYILLKGINDNKEEMNKFLSLAKEIDNKATIIIEFDYNDTLMLPKGSKFEVPKHYYELFELAKEYSNTYGMTFFMLPFTKMVLDKGFYSN